MQLPSLLSLHVHKAALTASASGTAAAVSQQVVETGVLEVGETLYAFISVLLGLAGVYLSRLVTIDAENKQLGRKQSLRETGPLTWIGVLIICPIVWHYKIAIPWASLMGLGVGYSVRVLLKLFGDVAVDSAEGLAQRMRGTFGLPAPDDEPSSPPAPPVPGLDAPGAQHTSACMPPSGTLPDQNALLDRVSRADETLPKDDPS